MDRVCVIFMIPVSKKMDSLVMIKRSKENKIIRLNMEISSIEKSISRLNGIVAKT